tara:strand:- start:198 stop:488 length:291 start_codon:yes stop_codon:yes gene_type:complete
MMSDCEITVKVKDKAGTSYYIFDLYNVPLKYWNEEDENKLIYAYLETDDIIRVRPEYIQLGDWIDDLSPEELKALKLSSDKEEDDFKLIQPSEEEE